MIRDITIGQYYPAASPIHRLDPRTKLTAVFIYIICLFITKSFIGFILPFALFFAVMCISKVPFGFALKGLKPVMLVIAMTMFFQVFFGRGEPLFSYGIICITLDGIKRGFFLAFRIVLLMLGTSVLTFTTTPNQITDGLESLLRPLRHVRFPVHEMAMMMSIALRFIPILIDETDRIMKAQQARGADFESGNIFHRAKSMIPVFIPLIVSAFRRALELAQAMEARCYHGGEGRTRLKPLKYTEIDKAAYVFILIFAAGCVLIRVFWN